MEISRELVQSERFKDQHRSAPTHFSRQGILTFPTVMMLLLQKSAKSAQLVLNEFLSKLKQLRPLYPQDELQQIFDVISDELRWRRQVTPFGDNV